MSVGIWIVREEARRLGEKIASELKGEIFTADQGSNKDAFRQHFGDKSYWVFVGATGIAVRFLDGLLDSKKSDPAVVVIDEAARFVLSLVGGHEGGGNSLAYKVSRITGATPVVTTATEALKPLVVGIGCRKGVTAQQVERAVLGALPEGRLVDDIREVATVDLKANEAGLLEWASGNGLPVRIISSKQIAGREWVTKSSDWVQENVGLSGVCEPAALIATPRGELLVPKTSLDGVSVAVVEDVFNNDSKSSDEVEETGGKLSLVSLGPGSQDLIVPRARVAIEGAEAVVGYGLYLDLIESWLVGKEIHQMPLTQEKARAEKAIELARSGKKVALVSSGDIGIYAMATLVFELLDQCGAGEIELEVIPGITAASSCAALLGSPLAHDFATLSLSDLLCPWEWIEQRARSIAEADLAVVLYNVQSKARPDGVKRVVDILLEHKNEDTVCGVVRNAYREEQGVEVCTLKELRQREFDMLTTVVVGNRFTKSNDFGVYSPRGYLNWDEERPEVPEGAVWVFSGTSDGNELAGKIAASGMKTVVSVSTDYGVEAAKRSLSNDVTVVKGSVGSEGRKQWLEESKAVCVVDATHPFAQLITEDLGQSCESLGIPCLRYERPTEAIDRNGCQEVDSFDEAIQSAMNCGKKIFLATGAKELDKVGEISGSESVEWFARLAPGVSSMERALKCGIPRANLCFMQGPFSTEFNRVQWQAWGIDCVVTRESGVGSGMSEKIRAAEALEIPVILIRRPSSKAGGALTSAEQVLEKIRGL